MVPGAAAAVSVPANQEDIELADVDDIEDEEAPEPDGAAADADIQLQQQAVPVSSRTCLCWDTCGKLQLVHGGVMPDMPSGLPSVTKSSIQTVSFNQ